MTVVNWLYIDIYESNLNLSLSLEDFVMIITTFSQPALLQFLLYRDFIQIQEEIEFFYLKI